MIQSLFEQSFAVQSLIEDYIAFIQHLSDIGETNAPSIHQFAIWRQEELDERGIETGPIPLVH